MIFGHGKVDGITVTLKRPFKVATGLSSHGYVRTMVSRAEMRDILYFATSLSITRDIHLNKLLRRISCKKDFLQ
jgi:hypothetical protein